MKNYDYAKALALITAEADTIELALLGMYEDWFWTAEIVFENGQFKKDLTDSDLHIAGIVGSQWGTPILLVNYKDGREVAKRCYVGESEGVRPEWMTPGGCLSGPCQESIANVPLED